MLAPGSLTVVRPFFALILVGLLIGGCNSSSQEVRPAKIEIHGASVKDRKIAADLRTYVGRNCPRTGNYLPTDDRELDPAMKKYITERYGSVEGLRDSLRHVCEGYRQITVKGGVITVTTTLEGETSERDAEEICNTIRGADVADFTPGHRVIDSDAHVLATCPAEETSEALAR